MTTPGMMERANNQSTALTPASGPPKLLQRYKTETALDLSSDVAHRSQTPPAQHTPGHVNCPACESVKHTLLSSITADLLFTEATEKYLALRSVAAMPGATRAHYIRPNTEEDYRQKLGAATLFFGQMKLGEIRWFHMKSYQAARVAGDPPFIRRRRPHEQPRPCPAKPKQVNQELRLVKKLMAMAGCWTKQDNEYFEYLQEEESDAERALTPEQQQRWLDVCRATPRFDLILWWSVASFDMLTSTNELRGLQLGHVNLDRRLVRVPWPAAKNRFRHRSIPVEDPECLWALDRLIARAYDLGARDPQHYLFPFKITRAKMSYPDRPMTESGIKKLWQEVREAADLLWFRPYDTRHTGATRMAENGVNPEMIMARLGHASHKMRMHYTHISEQAQRACLRGQPFQPIRALAPPPSWQPPKAPPAPPGYYYGAPPPASDPRYLMPPQPYAPPATPAANGPNCPWPPAEQWSPHHGR